MGQGRLLDCVQSYAAMREIGVRRGPAGHIRMILNGKEVFHYGPLDQGLVARRLVDSTQRQSDAVRRRLLERSRI